MIFGQKCRPRVRLRSSFGHFRFLAKSGGCGSGFGVVLQCCFILQMFTNVMASGELFLSFHISFGIIELYLFCSTIIHYFSQKRQK